ncbi:YaaL family protein [Bacillus carboniphilus]|uniref:YaaL family protein n=1 Tax=Bacillus carboniphilus TaxID=86663 RepID=A0ABN0WHQ5_9BACI
MLFRRKGWLKKEYDEKLVKDLQEAKIFWEQQRVFVQKSFEPSMELIEQANTAEAVYFSLLNEAKKRKVRIK